MGNQPNKEFTFYSLEDHPIDGNVTVYTIQGEGLFLMSKLIQCTPAINNLYNDISLEEQPNIIKFYGFQTHENPVMTCSNQCSQTTKNLKLSYWEFLNHDLSTEMKKNKKKLTDVFTWDIIEGSLDASLFFKKFKVFLDFKLKTIQFGVDMCPRIYWKNITPDNTHRYYYAYFYKHEFLKAYYSPEELSSIKSGVQNYKLNLQKCSVFSLGMTLLTFFSGMNLMNCYDFKALEINENMITEALEIVKQKYGQNLQYVLGGMVDFFIFKRRTFDQLKDIVRLARKSELQIPKISLKQQRQKITNSQKSSVSDSYFKVPDMHPKFSLKT